MIIYQCGKGYSCNFNKSLGRSEGIIYTNIKKTGRIRAVAWGLKELSGARKSERSGVRERIRVLIIGIKKVSGARKSNLVLVVILISLVSEDLREIGEFVLKYDDDDDICV